MFWKTSEVFLSKEQYRDLVIELNSHIERRVRVEVYGGYGKSHRGRIVGRLQSEIKKEVSSQVSSIADSPSLIKKLIKNIRGLQL